jgi:hypothetical protein
MSALIVSFQASEVSANRQVARSGTLSIVERMRNQHMESVKLKLF